MASTFGVLLFDGVEELDVAGPWEVLTVSARLREREHGDADRVVTISERGGEVRCGKGLRIMADHSFDDHPQLDVVVVPGGTGTQLQIDNPAVTGWLEAVAAKCAWVTSVCTGALLLHAAGPGRGCRLCTHWAFEDELAARGDCEVVSDQRWVVDGNVVSSQGVSAGIDMALWLVGEMYSPDHARATQRYMQYDPAPPYGRDG